MANAHPVATSARAPGAIENLFGHRCRKVHPCGAIGLVRRQRRFDVAHPERQHLDLELVHNEPVSKRPPRVKKSASRTASRRLRRVGD